MSKGDRARNALTGLYPRDVFPIDKGQATIYRLERPTRCLRNDLAVETTSPASTFAQPRHFIVGSHLRPARTIGERSTVSARGMVRTSADDPRRSRHGIRHGARSARPLRRIEQDRWTLR